MQITSTIYLFNWFGWRLSDLNRLEVFDTKIQSIEVLSEFITVVAT